MEKFHESDEERQPRGEKGPREGLCACRHTCVPEYGDCLFLITADLNSSRETLLREEVCGDPRQRRDELDKALNEAIAVWVNSVGE